MVFRLKIRRAAKNAARQVLSLVRVRHRGAVSVAIRDASTRDVA